ncbi:MAG: DUF5706 domain-containing protein [Immundisolibacteraceae bacterium]|nr:DUF5706 domain-containing protein [Immundisolibacteraceae bacterium]
MDKTQYLEKELSLLLGWIQTADSRISLVLPLSSTMLGVIAALAPDINGWLVSSAIFTSFAVFFLVLSIFFAALASFPRTEGPKGSLIFFSGINNREINQYRSEVENLDEEKLQNDLVSQCHVNAQIAHIKYTWVKRSLFCLFLSVLPWFISVYLLYEGA